MNLLEKDIEKMIMDNRHIIHERGFDVLLSTTENQYELPSGRIIDIMSFEIIDDELLLYIIELKKDKSGYDALLQAYRYFAELLPIITPFFKAIHCKIILVGKTVEDNPIQQFLFIPTESYTYKYDFNGLSFNMVKSNCDVPTTPI